VAHFLKNAAPLVEAARDDVARTVSEILSSIELGGMEAVRKWSEHLDGWNPPSFEVSAAELAAAEHGVDEAFKEAYQRSIAAVRGFAEFQRSLLIDGETQLQPGVIVGQRHVPVQRVGSYLPGGRYPLVSSPLMSVVVPRVAGVDRIVTCTPPSGGVGIHPAMLYAVAACGPDAVFSLGGVPALAAMTFGIGDIGPVDILCGAGNAYVAEAKRQLFGRVGIDLLAGPSEVAVICDDTASPDLVAADLLGQAEHGPNSPAYLISTDEAMAHAVIAEIEQQLPTLSTGAVAAAAWRDYGVVIVADDREDAARASDDIACEHLEVHAADLDWWHGRLRNYGSLFLGEWSTVTYSDKGGTGTNHTLPTQRGARYTAGLSVAKFLKAHTYQRVVDPHATRQIAADAVAFSLMDALEGHGRTAQMRLDRLNEPAAS
jgi:sulfopropanediol 3-dehydrogenase